jgi:hypothetical protein
MKQIELSKTGWKYKGQFSALVDDEDFEKVNVFNWRVLNNRKRYTQYGCREYPKDKVIYMHNFIFGEVPEGYTVDHIDRNGLNNQKSNLRLATKSEQERNKV